MRAVATLAVTGISHRNKNETKEWESQQIDGWLLIDRKGSAWMWHKYLLQLHYGHERHCQCCQWCQSLLSASQISNPKFQSRHGSRLSDSLPRGLLGFACCCLSWRKSWWGSTTKNATISPCSLLAFEILEQHASVEKDMKTFCGLEWTNMVLQPL